MALFISLVFCVFRVFAGSDNSFFVESASQGSPPSERALTKAERQDRIREQLRAGAATWTNKDLSEHSTSELVRMALIYSPSAASDTIHEELAKRPEEVRSELLKELESSPIPFDVLYRIPFVAGTVDTEFQVEVAKRCLFRNEMKEADMALQIQETTGRGIFSLIAQSNNDETGVIDRLVAEGRVEKGSEFEAKWRKRLAGREEKQTQIEKNSQETGDDASGMVSERTVDSGGRGNGAFDSENHSLWNYVVPGVLLGILALFFKALKGKSTS